MIDPELIRSLRQKRNLLAFSAGIDSTALFHLLLEANVPFDAALVNYQTRAQSDEEAAYAQTLCDRHGKRLFLKTVKLPAGGFEAAARKIRYEFFEETIRAEGYDCLFTAHQLDDWAEWFLMQFTKGAGFFELAGMRFWEEREGYVLVRPLLATPKKTIQSWLAQRNIKAFYDESNTNPAFKRNRFRDEYAQKMVDQHEAGILRSFYALQSDRDRLEQPMRVRRNGDLTLIGVGAPDAIHQIDQALKRLGHLPTHAERLLLEAGVACVPGRKIAVCFGEKRVFVAPYERAVLPKTFRERCRTLGVPPKIRPYLFRAGIDPAWCDTPSGQIASPAENGHRP